MVREEHESPTLVDSSPFGWFIQVLHFTHQGECGHGFSPHGECQEEREGPSADFIYEPEPEQILQRLLPVYLETEIYRALLESAAAFLASQMTAMRNASKNAGELIDNLTLSLNRARQAEITQEILEVVAGADALTG